MQRYLKPQGKGGGDWKSDPRPTEYGVSFKILFTAFDHRSGEWSDLFVWCCFFLCVWSVARGAHTQNGVA